MGTSTYSKPAGRANKYFEPYMKDFQHAENISNKIVVITGTTSGTGYALARECLKLKATVVCLNRDSPRVATMEENLRKDTAEGTLKTIVCDLSDFSSVKNAAAELKQEYSKNGIDILVNNAGVMALKDAPTKDGCCIQMQVNHLSHFLLTAELLPLLKTAFDKRGDARIVNHSSNARNNGPYTNDDIKYFGKNGGNLGGDTVGFAPFSGPRWKRYGETKVAALNFTYALRDRIEKSDKYKGVKVLCAHPGLSTTCLQVKTNADGGMGNMTCHFFMGYFAQSRDDGALGIITCSLKKDVKTGEFYGPKNDMFGAPESLPEEKEKCSNEQGKKNLWDGSLESTGASYSF